MGIKKMMTLMSIFLIMSLATVSVGAACKTTVDCDVDDGLVDDGCCDAGDCGCNDCGCNDCGCNDCGCNDCGCNDWWGGCDCGCGFDCGAIFDEWFSCSFLDIIFGDDWGLWDFGF